MTVWTVITANLNFLGLIGVFMIAYGAQRREKNHSTLLYRQLVALCFVVVSFVLFGQRQSRIRLGGVLGGTSTASIEGGGAVNTSLVSTLFECCLANSIALFQLQESTTYEADILFSVLFGAVIYPTAIGWSIGEGWLSQYGFQDPGHTASNFLLSSLCGFIGSIIVGPNFQNKANAFTRTVEKMSPVEVGLGSHNSQELPTIMQNLTAVKNIKARDSNGLHSSTCLISEPAELYNTPRKKVSSVNRSNKRSANLSNRSHARRKDRNSRRSSARNNSTDSSVDAMPSAKQLDSDLILNKTITDSDSSTGKGDTLTKNKRKSSTPQSSQNLANEFPVKQEPNQIEEEEIDEPNLSEIVDDCKQQLGHEYTTSGLDDEEIVKYIALMQQHLVESKQSFKFNIQTYYSVGAFLLWVSLMVKSIVVIYVPTPSILTEAASIEEAEQMLSNQRVNSPNQPGVVLTGALLASAGAVCSYQLTISCIQWMAGPSQGFRCHHLMNCMLSGAVVSTGLSSLTNPFLCMLSGVVAGGVYCVVQRILLKWKSVPKSEIVIIFALMTFLQTIFTALMSTNKPKVQNQNQVSIHILAMFVISAWGILWSWPLFELLNRMKRLRFGEIYEIVGLDSMTLNSQDFYMKFGFSKEITERIECKQRTGQKLSTQSYRKHFWEQSQEKENATLANYF